MHNLLFSLFVSFIILSSDAFSQSRVIEPQKKDSQFERNYIEASKYKITRDYPMALQLFEELLKSHPNEAILHYEISRIHWIQRKYKEAEQSAQAAYAMNAEGQ